MMANSVRLRLLAGGLLAIALALIIAGMGLAYLFERHIVRTIGDELDVHMSQLLAGLEIGADNQVVVNRLPVDPRFAIPLSGLYWQVSDDRGISIGSRSLWDATITLAQDTLALGQIHHHTLIGPGATDILVVERMVQLTRDGAPVPIRVAIGADLGRASRATSAFARELALALCLLALVLALAMSMQIALGLQPLEKVRSQIAEIRSANRNQMASDVPVEVRPLVEEINALLTSQENEIERSRGRAADLAHGLKTPLAALSADVDRLRAAGQTAIATEIQEIGDAMHRHVNRELARARVRGAARRNSNMSCDVKPLIASLIATLKRANADRPIAMEDAVPHNFKIAMDRTDLAEVLGNLLENAARHATSRVRVVASTSANGRSSLTVEDDGPGIAPAHRAAMLERGNRLDTRGNGAGLGLAIVQDVLDAYGWRLDLDTSSLGGLAATLQVPAS